MKKLQRIFNFEDLKKQHILKSVFAMHDNVELFHVEKSYSLGSLSNFFVNLHKRANTYMFERFTGE